MQLSEARRQLVLLKHQKADEPTARTPTPESLECVDACLEKVKLKSCKKCLRRAVDEGFGFYQAVMGMYVTQRTLKCKCVFSAAKRVMFFALQLAHHFQCDHLSTLLAGWPAHTVPDRLSEPPHVRRPPSHFPWRTSQRGQRNRGQVHEA